MAHTAESLQAAFKYLWLDEVQAIKELARSLPDNPVVINIGAGSGTSGLAFMESKEDLFLVTIDIEAGKSPFGSLLSEKQILEQAGYNNRVSHRYWLDSKTAGKSWLTNSAFRYEDGQYPVPSRSREKVDMVFIDGDHSYEGCKGDIEAWLPNIKSGGIIAVHDYMKSELYAHKEDYKGDAPHPAPWLGVDRAVKELLVPNYEQVLRVKSLIAFRI